MLLPGWAPGDLAAALKVFINLLLKVRAGARLALFGTKSRFAPWVRSSDGTPLLAGRCGRGRRRHRCLDLDLLCPQCLPQIAMACADFDVGDGQLGGGMYRLHWVVVLLWGQTTDTGRPPIGASSDEFSLDAWLAWGLGR